MIEGRLDTVLKDCSKDWPRTSTVSLPGYLLAAKAVNRQGHRSSHGYMLFWQIRGCIYLVAECNRIQACAH